MLNQISFWFNDRTLVYLIMLYIKIFLLIFCLEYYVSNVICCIKEEISMEFTGNGLAGMRQKDLIQWYVDQQNERNNYSSMEEVAAEISKIKAIIEVCIC